MRVGYYKVDNVGTAKFIGYSSNPTEAAAWAESETSKDINICHCGVLHVGMELPEGIIGCFWHITPTLVAVCYSN